MNVAHVFFVFLLFVFLSPALFLIGICIYIFNGRPVIFRQKRIGQNGKPFILYKFRTMQRDAEKTQRMYTRLNEADGPVFKIYDDPRFTSLGKFLSHTGFDELPQLWNILRGDMAFFGPRPLPLSESEKLLAWQKKRQLIKPGILSPWVLDGYHTRTFVEWMRSDCAYVEKKSFWYDTTLFFHSLRFMLRLFLQEVS